MVDPVHVLFAVGVAAAVVALLNDMFVEVLFGGAFALCVYELAVLWGQRFYVYIALAVFAIVLIVKIVQWTVEAALARVGDLPADTDHDVVIKGVQDGLRDAHTSSPTDGTDREPGNGSDGDADEHKRRPTARAFLQSVVGFLSITRTALSGNKPDD